MPSLDENPFWDFSLAVYDRAGVAPACLALQDRHGLDVNLLLFCLWAGACGRALTAAELDGLIAAVRPWQDGVVAPLRAVRRWLKAQQSVPNASAAALRSAIKERELDAEAIEQEILFAHIPIPAAPAAPAAAAANLALYLTAAGISPDSDDTARLAALLRAGFPELAPPDALRLLEGCMGPAGER